MYLSQLLSDVKTNCVQNPVLIFEDNQGTIALSKNPVNRSRAKHIDIRYHFIRSEIARGRVVVKYCPTENMVADIMTKPVTKVKLEKFKGFIFGM